jgi:hypothetical protein
MRSERDWGQQRYVLKGRKIHSSFKGVSGIPVVQSANLNVDTSGYRVLQNKGE